MKRWLEDQASEAGTSVNDEVIRIVRAAMRQEARQRQKHRHSGPGNDELARIKLLKSHGPTDRDTNDDTPDKSH